MLSLSPGARLGSWNAGLRWEHWFGYAVWLVLFLFSNQQTKRNFPQRDPYLLPVAALLSGWGLVTIWRLSAEQGWQIGPFELSFGARQAVWLVVSVVIFLLSLRLPTDLGFLRRYKYVLLSTGLLLTALTLLLGTNPSSSAGPRLWFGAFGVFVQPSEPLKLLLITYLAGYLAGISGSISPNLLRYRASLLPLLAPTLVMTGLALLVLFIQRDLGTASIFIFIYAVLVYLASGRKSFLALSALTLVVASAAGYALFDVVRVRVDAWVNPWLDPSGRSYQIIQALIAIANGGMIGRGPGLGSPGLVPVPHSDFIYTAIVEETGLAGGLGLLLVIALLAARGLRAALYAPDAYRRYLAAGVTTYLVAQSILIIGGNVRLLPLTGVTLPFVSYGGSSLLTAFISLAILLHISHQGSRRPLSQAAAGLYLQLGGFLFAGLAAAGLVTGWWAFYRSDDLLTRTDNPRRSIADQYVRRGSLLDRKNQPLVESAGSPGSFSRLSVYPPLSLVTGYTHPFYGQAGLEASLDPYLRGYQGNTSEDIWMQHLLYGLPPEGLNVRTTLDLDLQRTADSLLEGENGALVLLSARTGEILVMSSHPGFDPNLLDETWDDLVNDPQAPLLNRATQGQYPAGPSLGVFLLAETAARSLEPDFPNEPDYTLLTAGGSLHLECAMSPSRSGWAAWIAAGCPAPVVALGQAVTQDANDPQTLLTLYSQLGLYTAPAVNLPAAPSSPPVEPASPELAALGLSDLRLSPLQMAIAAAALSAGGEVPSPQLVQAVQPVGRGWVLFPVNPGTTRIFPAAAAQKTAQELQTPGLPFWQAVVTFPSGPSQNITWYLAGTLPSWQGEPFSLALVLENKAPEEAVTIGQAVLQAGINPASASSGGN